MQLVDALSTYRTKEAVVCLCFRLGVIKGLTFSFLIASAVENLAHVSTVIPRLSLLPGSPLNRLLTLDHALHCLKFKNEVRFYLTVPQTLPTGFLTSLHGSSGLDQPYSVQDPLLFFWELTRLQSSFPTLVAAVGGLGEVSWYISERCSAIKPSSSVRWWLSNVEILRARDAPNWGLSVTTESRPRSWDATRRYAYGLVPSAKQYI